MFNFSDMKKYRIGVVGLWHLGEIFSAGLAELGYTVIGFDDASIITNLNQGKPPLAEPGLSELVAKHLASGRLSYSHDFSKLESCDVIWLAIDTPVNDRDEVDVSSIWNFFKNHSKKFTPGALVAISSQLPIGTCASLKRFFNENYPEKGLRLAYVPENLQLGQALKSFFEPGRFVIGADDQASSDQTQDVLSPLKTNNLVMSIASAELSKHALNSFLATSLSFIYDIADVAEQYGADVVDVAKALRSDSRIGPEAYLDASIGFSGGTLARDLTILVEKAKEAEIKLPVIQAVVTKNQERRSRLIEFLEKKLGALARKNIAVMGLTYKPGTPTLRRALSIEVIMILKGKGAIIHAYDPLAEKNELHALTGLDKSNNPYECAEACQAVLFLTGCSEFKDLDFVKLRSKMATPWILFDARNFLIDQEKKIQSAGFVYQGVGRASFDKT